MDFDLLMDVQNIRSCRAEGAPCRCHAVKRYEHALYAQLARKHTGVNRPSATESEEREVTRIKALLHRGFTNDVGHFEFSNLGNAGCCFHQA